jgi:hypothetical protein
MRYMPVAEAAGVLAYEARRWTEADLEPLGLQGEPIVKEEVWQRCVADAEREIRRAVKAGELESKGAGKTLTVRAGSLDDWLGKSATLSPDWAASYHALPDDEAEAVERDRATLARLQRAIATPPLLGGTAESLNEMIEGLEKGLKSSAESLRTELRLVDVILDEISEHFDGDDVLRPQARKPLEDTRQALAQLAQAIYDREEVPALVQPTVAALSQMQSYLDRQKRLFAETLN